MNQENTSRHLALELDDIKNNLVQVVNNAVMKGVPCFLLEYIVSELNSQVHNRANEEREMARKEEEQRNFAKQQEELKQAQEENKAKQDTTV